MNLLALGVDHRLAPTSIRERLAFDSHQRHRALRELSTEFPGCEFVLLSTCNRVELYVASNDRALPEVPQLRRCLSAQHGLDESVMEDRFTSMKDVVVIGHLFRVASGLESLVLGEGEILGQVREAYRASVECGTAGPIVHGLFQRALRVGKEVRDQTGLGQGRLSVASVAVELARSVFDHFADKTVLVIGAGKMGDLTLQHLSVLRPGRILVTNRNRERAEKAAQRWPAEIVPFERLDDALVEADLVVSTTAADQPIVTFERYAQLQRKQRGGRLALILDIAVPRDFDPRIGDLEQVLLYNVDDLRSQVEKNLGARREHVEPALTAIEREAAVCVAELRHQAQAGDLLRELGNYGDTLSARELQRFFEACPGLTDEHRAAAELLVHRLKNQFLHHPRAALRTAIREATNELSKSSSDAHPMLSAVRHLFGLGNGPNEKTRQGGSEPH